MQLTLYRGIALESDSVEESLKSIRSDGLTGDEGSWSFSVPSASAVREQLEETFVSDRPSANDIFGHSPFKGICACGDEDGARYYALKHNRTKEKTVGIVIAMTVDIDRVHVDYRDFLRPAFQLWDRDTADNVERQRFYLGELFGDAVLRYFERSVLSPDQSIRAAMCGLAAFDETVVKSHWKNERLIGGRYATRFKSAFFVQGPVSPSEIDSCEPIDGAFSEGEVFVDLPRFIGAQ